ncbi:MAG: cobalamin-binding protein [Nitrosopumilales archaeon CG15_BIG_FIL_POST_REV_8_21_14_020_37_12]|nr:MAG: cobalamin-binding protein [Nitrosopumilales archaeon CG15_BIG_FIL_POST_REV_8_21_14_020_37_12]
MINRIVSFLPSATELLYEFGEEGKIFGVTHECKYPEEAKAKPKVINSVIDSEQLSSKEIDKQTCQLLKEGKDIFLLDEDNIRKADPDLIISQETCEVCAAHTNQVNKTIKIMQKRPLLYSMNPHNFDEIILSVIKLGKILQKENKANEIASALKKRIQKIKDLKVEQRPKVLAIEWIEPLFTAGHWVPEMIEIAGGQNIISKTGEHSRRLSIEEIIKSDPDIIIVMPCGFDAYRTVQEYNQVLDKDASWKSLKAVKNNKVFGVDANSFFSKPSIRTVTGIEILAKIIQPEKTIDLDIPRDSFLHIK